MEGDIAYIVNITLSVFYTIIVFIFNNKVVFSTAPT